MRLTGRLIVFTAVGVLVASQLGSALPVNAVSGGCFFTDNRNNPVGQTTGCGEAGFGDYGTNDVFSGRDSSGGGTAIDKAGTSACDGGSKVANKAQFICFIKNRFASGQSDRNRIGAGFVIREMLGGAHTWPSAADLSDWETRMSQPEIDFESVDSARITRTSWYDNDKKNTFYDDYTVNRDVVRIRKSYQVSETVHNNNCLNDADNTGTCCVHRNRRGECNRRESATVTQTVTRYNRLAEIERACGNLVAGTDPLPPPPPGPWVVEPEISLATPATANPGDTVVWNHRVVNSGPSHTDQAISFGYDGKGVDGWQFPWAWGGGQPRWAASDWMQSSYVVTQADVGQRICRETLSRPYANTNPGTKNSAVACVDVPSRFTLTPSISVNPDAATFPGGTLTATPRVTNSGSISSTATNWSISSYVLPPRTSPDVSGGLAPSDVCSRHPDCRVLSQGQADFGVGDPSTATYAGDDRFEPSSTRVPEDAVPGTRVCFALAVHPHATGDPSYAISAAVCVVVAKIPTIQVKGHDLRVGGSITAGLHEGPGQLPSDPRRTYGSWVEYGVFSGEGNAGGSSGAGLALGSANPNQRGWSDLTFANVAPDGSSSFGSYSPSFAGQISAHTSATRQYFADRCVDDPQVTGSTINVVSLSSGAYHLTGNVTLHGGQVPSGRSVILCVDGTATIGDDLAYDTSAALQKLSDIPQVVIVANNIAIDGDVRRVDAWLIAGGEDPDGFITTCDDVDLRNPGLSVNVCRNKLVVNGPVMTGHLYLYRTHTKPYTTPEGNDSPAETFSLPASAFLWAANYSNSRDVPQTTYIKELPPRF